MDIPAESQISSMTVLYTVLIQFGELVEVTL